LPRNSAKRRLTERGDDHAGHGQDRQKRSEHTGQADAAQAVGQGSQYDGDDKRSDRRQEHHRTDRQHEGQRKEQPGHQEQHDRRLQPRARITRPFVGQAWHGGAGFKFGIGHVGHCGL
jgi:hypothetical protein